MSRELVKKITRLKTIYDAQPVPALLKDKVVWAYARKTLDRLTIIIEQEENVTEALETFLKDNWALVNGTLLSPEILGEPIYVRVKSSCEQKKPFMA